MNYNAEQLSSSPLPNANSESCPPSSCSNKPIASPTHGFFNPHFQMKVVGSLRVIWVIDSFACPVRFPLFVLKLHCVLRWVGWVTCDCEEFPGAGGAVACLDDVVGGNGGGAGKEISGSGVWGWNFSERGMLEIYGMELWDTYSFGFLVCLWSILHNSILINRERLLCQNGTCMEVLLARVLDSTGRWVPNL